MIHDNVVVGVTQIASSGTWSSSKCYLRGSSDNLSNRADVCDGNKLKPAKPKKASAAEAPDVERPQVAVADGPGPHNEGAVDEEIGEIGADAIAEEPEAVEEQQA